VFVIIDAILLVLCGVDMFGARYPGGHILSRSDLDSSVPLLRQNGFLPPPVVHLNTVFIPVPELSNKTITKTGVLTYDFVIPPAPPPTQIYRVSSK
jgi:hypothetical protein